MGKVGVSIERVQPGYLKFKYDTMHITVITYRGVLFKFTVMY